MLDRLTIERAIAIAGEGPIVIALSGGGDSTALLHLMAEAVPKQRLCAAIIDHALRPGSAVDAARAAGFAAALGIAVEATTLEWPEPTPRAQEAARAARYRALCDIARSRRARVIALGHTADDQAETVLMRAAAGSTWRGLAAMAAIAPAPVWPEGRDIWLARPLLHARRGELRAHLRARGAEWIEDPANANPVFTRVRARDRLARLSEAGLDPTRLVQVAQRLQARVERLENDAAALLAYAARFEDGGIVIDLSRWRGGVEARRRALSVVITAAAGAEREPAGGAVERLEARLSESSFRGATLGGAVLRRGKETVAAERDPGALMGRAGGAQPLPLVELPARRATVWDGRLELVAQEQGWRIEAGRLGPILTRNGRAMPLRESGAAVKARWLVRDHVAHLLGRSLPP